MNTIQLNLKKKTFRCTAYEWCDVPLIIAGDKQKHLFFQEHVSSISMELLQFHYVLRIISMVINEIKVRIGPLYLICTLISLYNLRMTKLCRLLLKNTGFSTLANAIAAYIANKKRPSLLSCSIQSCSRVSALVSENTLRDISTSVDQKHVFW